MAKQGLVATQRQPAFVCVHSRSQSLHPLLLVKASCAGPPRLPVPHSTHTDTHVPSPSRTSPHTHPHLYAVRVVSVLVRNGGEGA